jgi:glycosyltransferase involved in cell wall biosynthesis
VSPRKLIRGRYWRKKIKEFERKIKPDIVFNVFGPPAVKYDTLLLCGCANGWSTHPNKEVFSIISTKKRIKYKLKRIRDKVKFRQAEYFWVEAEIAQKGLSKLLNVQKNKIKIISNVLNPVFDDVVPLEADFAKDIKILTLSSPGPNKNLTILPDIAAFLKENVSALNFTFTLTFSPSDPLNKIIYSKAEKLDVAENICNIGMVPLAECPRVYNEHHILLQPSLLETFSANYIEAMKMKRPIVTVDMEFARNICGDAAIYYSPLLAQDAGKKIALLACDAEKRDEIINNGNRKLNSFPSHRDTYEMFLDYIVDILKKEKKTCLET